MYYAKLIAEKGYSLLGQLNVSDDEYYELLSEAKQKVRFLQCQSIVPSDLLLSLTLVQIAVRHYRDGNYWTSFLEEIGVQITAPKCNFLGQIFVKTLAKYGLFIIPQNNREVTQYVENIKAHAFVTNYYLNGYFDFAYVFFEKNLFRDLTGEINEDFEDLSLFMQSTLTNKKDILSSDEDGRAAAKTYKLLRSTRMVFAYGEAHLLQSMFLPTLEMIDRYYYDLVVPDQLGNRFERAFAAWIQDAEVQSGSELKKRSDIRRVVNRRPYLVVNPRIESAALTIPAQKFRNEDCKGEAWVTVEIGDYSHKWELNLYRSFGIYISEELKIPVPDIFDEIHVVISALTQRESRIAKSNYRIFNTSWENTQKPAIGHNYLLIKKQLPVSWEHDEDVIELSDDHKSWRYLSVSVSEHTVFYIANRPLSIMGEFSLEPVFERVIDSFSIRDQAGKLLTATRTHPEISFVVDKNRFHGTSLLVNGKRYPVDVIQEKTSFEWPQDKKMLAVTVYLENVLANDDGLFHIILDIPAQGKRTLCSYLLLKTFRCRFNKRKYTYDREILLEIDSSNHKIIFTEPDWTEDENDTTLLLHIPIKSGMRTIMLRMDDNYDVTLPVKTFQYGFSRSEMRCDKPDYLWHSEIGETLYVTIPGASQVDAYWCKEPETIVHGFQTGQDSFQLDISEIKQRILSESKKHWQYINLIYTDNAKRRLSLPAILRSVELRPYFKLKYTNETPCIDVEEILGNGSIYLNIQEKGSGKVIILGKEITVGINQFPELSPGVLYDLFPYCCETDAFGLSSEPINLKPILGVSFTDWRDLTNCRLPVESIQFEGEELLNDYDYFITLTKQVDSGTYIGTMFARKLAAKGKERYERNAAKKYIQKQFGKVQADISTQGDEMLLSLKMHSVIDGDWMAPFYDAQRKIIVHCDDPKLQQKDPTGTRFLLLDEYETVMKINTDRIARVSYSPQIYSTI